MMVIAFHVRLPFTSAPSGALPAGVVTNPEVANVLEALEVPQAVAGSRTKILHGEQILSRALSKFLAMNELRFVR